MPAPPPADILHASAVAFAERGVLILGASGTGKSALALELMALGAGLVADDRTCLSVSGGALVASCPETLSGLIEARNIGLLNARPQGPTRVGLVITLDETESERLPPFRTATLLGVTLPLLHKVAHRAFPAAIVQYMKDGRCE